MNRFYLPIILILCMTSCGYTPTYSPIVIKDVEKNVPRTIKGPTIRILSWNTHKEGNNKKWINDILNVECTKDPDIVLFQEATLNAGLRYILKAKKYDWRFVPNAIKNGEYAGVLTASKSASFNDIPVLSDQREPVTETPKATLITSYFVNSNGKEVALLIVNVHGINFVSEESFGDQIDKIYNLLRQYVKSHAIIVAGDFNTWSSPRVEKLKESFGKLRLTEVELQNASTPPWFAYLFTPIEKLPLDRVFYSSDRLYLDSNKSRALDCVDSSDHKPLYIEFMIR